MIQQYRVYICGMHILNIILSPNHYYRKVFRRRHEENGSDT